MEVSDKNHDSVPDAISKESDEKHFGIELSVAMRIDTL